jgi:quinol-cytochrome oxidoreductase complex cytochrome b subunit
MAVIKQNQNEEITRAKKKPAKIAEGVKSSSDNDQEAVRAKIQSWFTPKNHIILFFFLFFFSLNFFFFLTVEGGPWPLPAPPLSVPVRWS